MEAWQSQPASDIVAVGVQLLRSRVRLLAGMLRTGMVKAEVRSALPAGPCSHQCDHQKLVLSLASRLLQLARKHCTAFMVGHAYVDPVLLAHDCSTLMQSCTMTAKLRAPRRCIWGLCSLATQA